LDVGSVAPDRTSAAFVLALVQILIFVRSMALAEAEDETTQGIRLPGKQDPAF
jgi:hypothetical protein